MGTKYHFFGHIETWAQRDAGTKRRGHKIPLFGAQRDVGTKYHFPGHIETWAQRDVGTKRCFGCIGLPVSRSLLGPPRRSSGKDVSLEFQRPEVQTMTEQHK